jgi:acyl-CoA hydrolase
MKEMKAKGVPIMAFGEVNENMPFMVNDAIIEAEELDCIVEDKACNTRLFAPPYMAVLTTDYMIGLNASSLVRDGGTLQIGIGSLGDACAYALELRESDNAIYNEVLADIGAREKWGDLIDEIGGTDTFSEGLYGCSEMFVSGFMELMKANIVRRPVWDDIGLQRLINDKKVNPQSINADILDMLLEAGSINNPLTEANVAMLGKYGILKGNPTLKGEAIVTADGTHYGNNIEELRAIVGDKLIGGIIMHGGFFLGCNDFYDDLRSLTPEQNASINMTSIGFVNHLYGDEALKLVQRRDFRMINTCFTATALGAAVSDQTEDGKMVSGVGGQYNFVSMAHEMPDGRSIMMCKSSRGSSASNIVWKYGHTTIPRHLRDIFVTEYGVVNVRNMPDKDVIAKMLNISDSRFQQALMDEAKAAGKLPANYQIPELYRQNTPQKLESILNKYRAKDKFPPFPFGCELTEQELIIGRALKVLKAKSTGPKVPFLKQVLRALMYTPTAEVQPFLDRMKGDTLSKVEKGLLAMEVQAVLASKK